MDIGFILLLLAGGALILPLLSDDDDDEVDDRNQIRGTLGDDDPLNGTDGDDNILAFDGDDVINAGAGIDTVIAGLGDDTVNGGDNRDIIEGRGGNDTLNGEDGNDTIEGGAGNDIVDGGFGSDVVRGGRGDDDIFGGFGARLIDGELVNATERTDTLRGEGGSDEIYMWGGGGLASGGIDDDENDIPDEKDVLVLVTGEGELRDDQGTTDFYALANIEDEEETFATITEFDRDEHRMILTVDIDLTGEMDTPEIDFTVTETMVNGVNGVLVEATLVNEADFEDGTFETSSAFFRGATIPDGLTDEEIQDYFDIEVVQTDATTNDYFNPEATVDTIEGLIPANPPST